MTTRFRVGTRWLVALVAVSTVGTLPALRAAESAEPVGRKPAPQPVEVRSDGRSPALCGPEDDPETGVQGDVPLEDQLSGRAAEGYECGISVVGRLDRGGGNVTGAGHCAYVQAADGVRVVDVSDPESPVQTALLPTGTAARTNIHAVTSPTRALLATVRDAEPDGLARDRLVDIWDVRDCTVPERLGVIRFPTTNEHTGDPEGGGPVHNVKLTPDATKVYGTLPLQVADISDLEDPSTWTARDLACDIYAQFYPPFMGPTGRTLCEQAPFGAGGPQLAHEPEFNPAGTRMYIAGQLPGAYDNTLRVLDLTVSPPEIIGSLPDSPGHGIDFATIDGQPYLLHSNEITAAGTTCVPQQRRPSWLGWGDRAFLTDLDDETAPARVSTLALAINTAVFCPDRLASQVESTIHYHTVDDHTDTTFAALSMNGSGLRVFDVRDPGAPVEVAYFNHGSTGDLPHYDQATGHFWVSTPDTFWVLELQPQVREHLGLRQPGAGPPPWSGQSRPSHASG